MTHLCTCCKIPQITLRIKCLPASLYSNTYWNYSNGHFKCVLEYSSYAHNNTNFRDTIYYSYKICRIVWIVYYFFPYNIPIMKDNNTDLQMLKWSCGVRGTQQNSCPISASSDLRDFFSCPQHPCDLINAWCVLTNLRYILCQDIVTTSLYLAVKVLE